ncbi:hypothetical protein [Brevibacillus parabrevis]|uniref:hypothetical protein n=1 Tax=Brevibacillus parabrevis TaxID=54914 RepID=UPI0028D1748A|nr:hypothetical protein [Brevibacillus parabrevis]
MKKKLLLLVMASLMTFITGNIASAASTIKVFIDGNEQVYAQTSSSKWDNFGSFERFI